MEVMDIQTGERLELVTITPGQSRNKQRKLIKAYLTKYFKTSAFITLGCRKGIEEYDVFNRAVQALFRDFETYIYVMELGKKGERLHCHILTSDYVDIRKIRTRWEKLIGEEKTHIDIMRCYGEIDSATAYIVKYVTKEKLSGIRTFRTSKNLRRHLAQQLEEINSKERKIDLYYIKEVRN